MSHLSRDLRKNKRWTFEPDEPVYERRRKAYRSRREREVWYAPEHQKIAASMKKDYPRTDLGEVIRGAGRSLVVDPRPAILVPPRPTIMGYK